MYIYKLKGNEVISIDDCNILYSYYDHWKSTTERRNAVFQGIVEVGGQMVNTVKHRRIKKLMQGMKQWHQFSMINFLFIRL